ncbi:double-strand break repair helicase AddA [Acidocella sp. KAb 2-4]|uniref:double-strand break repair helicase AddA n=1 Tax=Acidocella sp. KAb 2-4 TaxID=2885158 RepID=UPI001D07E887|nr:double-strand break repair helicase AddA [Acidocella sp. KAb 2-4]MCB5944475.1 double-strand break repair helicase AddA [Acidocella sp. KAb 2-4]
MSAIVIANAQQLQASDPAVSAFVAASAGSGKTKLLTDRLLRLMLAGTAPEKILCLTYTKAAAAEMRIRLNKRLGEWVVKEDAALRADLAALNVPASAATLALARQLFAQVLDLPGGMRIETIHAFCQSLLRRFPLEAGLSPHFEVADDEQATRRLREAREAALADPGAREAVRALAAQTNEQDFAELTQQFVLEAPVALLNGGIGLDQLAAQQRGALGAGELSEAELLAAAVNIPREAELREILQAIAERGNATGVKNAYPLLDWLALPPEARAAHWDDWAHGFLTEGKPRTFKGYCGAKLKTEEDDYKAALLREASRILAALEALKAARLAALNAHLARLLLPIAASERGEKLLASQLSYGDLISHTEKLLIDPGAAWVLYKLDGGLEHLLLDEVQDTAPEQWEIATALAGEFFAGEGAREASRSIFAVGDAKQSIFSFQGADLRSFGKYRERFKAKAVGAGRRWLDGELSVSFRSTAPVLALTDAVFAAGPARAGVVAPGETLKHEVSRAGQAGRVLLWPLAQAREAGELPAWGLAEDYASADSARAVLARDIAAWVAERLRQPLPSRHRRARPGDFLILVRRRDALVGAVTAALKARGIPVAGLDRMVLTAQQPVSDLLALCDALLLPDDDLAFGQFLASPLGGLSDAALMELALGRGAKKLVEALYSRAGEREDWAAAKSFFEALRAKADFLPPYALLAEALGPLGGRAKLLRRLGAEAAEPIDEFLAEALAFAGREPGSLQMFTAALRQTSATIKRETEAGGDEVRIMTVHGAKGLQAPIVILPDTAAMPDHDRTLFWLDVPQENAQVPVFCPRSDARSEAVARAAEANKEAARQEYNRLLYVALTRAEDELLVCGAEGKKGLPEHCWYEAVREGFARLPARDENGVQVYDCEQSAPPDRAELHVAAQPAALPGWLSGAPGWQAAPPPKEAAKPERIVPSRGVDEAAKRAIAASPLGTGLAAARAARMVAMERGTAIHALLQHLPDLPAAQRPETAAAYLAAQPGLADESEKISAAVLAILSNPTLAPLFGPESRAEVPLAGVVNGREIGGMVDRLALTPGEIWLADYKTDRAPPASPAGIPPQYLTQLAAYRAILRDIHPGRAVRAVLIWTQSATAMDVPGATLDGAAPA